MFTCGITPRNDFIFPLDICLFCHNCNTLTSLYWCVWLACKSASPGVSRTTGLKLITPCQCEKLLWGHFHWLVMYDQKFGFCYLCRPTANIRENRRDDSCEVGTYLNQCLQLSVQLCPREKHRWFLISNLECVLKNCWQIICRPSSSELLGYPALHSRFDTSMNKSATSR